MTTSQEFLAGLQGTTVRIADPDTGEILATVQTQDETPTAYVDPNQVEAPNNTKKFVQALYDVYVQMEPLADMEKDIKGKIKEAGLNPAVLAAVAKAKVQGKLSDLEEKSAEILNTIEKAE